jgi:hypothetical protein
LPDLLLYQTSDPAFANRALEALQDAEIPCYRTGEGYWSIPTARRDLGTGICIYIEREADYQAANEIIVKLGAAVDVPIRLPSRRVVFIVVFVVTVIAVLVAFNWR